MRILLFAFCKTNVAYGGCDTMELVLIISILITRLLLFDMGIISEYSVSFRGRKNTMNINKFTLYQNQTNERAITPVNKVNRIEKRNETRGKKWPVTDP